VRQDETNVADGIAIIGLAGKFPGAPNLDVFWQNLRNGVESVTHFSEEELEAPASLRQNPQYVRARAIVEGVDLFDAEFFGINPREAEYTDPQHRLLLETAWEALENAGYDSEQFPGSIGVFAGCSLNTYLLHNLASHPEFLARFLSSQQMGAHPSMLGNDKDFLATRISYKLNLRGPSVVVQSACSTSLVAICQACQNLLTFQCDLALAGGVSVTFPQKRGYLYEDGAIVSKDGRCRPFDAAADGTVFGDGVGLVVLKRADEAIRDGDHIRAIIRGFAINNDGSGKVSYMAPSVDGQADAIAAAQALAGVDVETIRYIEAHGTGTSLGDPIEIAALTKAFGARTSAREFCALGALKGNVGHLEVAAGVAGLIKTTLALEQGEIPPTINFSRPNPRIDFPATPFYVNRELKPWPALSAPRRAGVSAFGVGGTNAHVVLEQAPAVTGVRRNSPAQLLVLSAKTASALESVTRRLVDQLRLDPEADLGDVAFTLQIGRRALRHRRSLVCRSAREAIELLGGKTPLPSADTHGRKSGVAFLFPGQGAQHVGMGRDLYENEPVFRAQVDACCELLAPELGLDLRSVLYPSDPASPAAQSQLTQTSLTQPALFVVEYALAQTWLARGVHPQVMIGHSLGEYVAAVLAEVFTLKDALHLLAVRGGLMQVLPGGSMLAVALPEEELAPFLGAKLALAAVNGPRSCVVSGPTDAITALNKRLADKSIAGRELKTSHAFHSLMMDPILAEFENEVRRVPRREPKIPIISSLYGREGTAAEWMDPGYWSGQLRRTVRFADALGALLSRENLALLEVGPGQTLTALARQHAAKKPDQILAHSFSRTRSESDGMALLAATGQLWLAGVEIKWAALHDGARRRVALPTYPFERKRHWIEPRSGTMELSARPAESTSVGETPDASQVQGKTMTSSVPIETSTEAAVRSIFADLSGRDLGAADATANFFDLGFDSLLLAQASQSLRQKFDVKVSFRQLMENLVTMEALSKYLEEQSPGRHVAVSAPVLSSKLPEVADQTLPLTDAQQGLWLLAALNKNAERAYRDSLTLSLTGDLDRASLAKALQAVVDRHGALRTTIHPEGHTQTVHARHTFALGYFDFSTLPPNRSAAELAQKFRELESQTFADMNGPFLLATLLKVSAQRHLLVLGFHHIVGNGPSYWLFMNEVASLYRAYAGGGSANLPPVFPFSEFVEKRQAYENSGARKEAERFWLKQMGEGVPLLDLPFDYPHPPELSYLGAREEIILEPRLTEALRKIGAAQRCSLFMVLLSAYGLLLHRLSGQEDLFIGVPFDSPIRSEGAGRNLFANSTNTLPLKSTLHEGSSFVDHLLLVRHLVLAASEHQDYFFGHLVGKLNLKREPGRSLFFNSIFNLETAEFHRVLPGLEIKLETHHVPYRTPQGIAMFDLSINAAERKNGEIITQCDYNTTVIAPETMQRWLAYFHTLLRGIAADPNQPADSLPLVPPEKRVEALISNNPPAATPS
jgi:acyl transferase domain-containing protein